MKRRFTSLFGAAALASCAGAPPPVGPPPPSLALDPFYAKSVDASGIPISASQAVPDAALQVARRMIVAMLERRPDIARELVRAGQRVMVMGVDEQTTDVPEQRDWKKPAIDDPRLTRCERKHYDERIGHLTDREYWGMRARGMGGLLTSAATENLLGVPGTRYYGETILVHEFSHAILSAVQAVDPALYARVAQAYAASSAKRLWTGEYGSTTVQEYWAEGTQFWFNSNRLAVVNGVRILSDADLAHHDPALAAVLRAVYGNRHRLPGDPFYKHPARVPPGPIPKSTAEIC
ncbi:glycoside hydrolase [Sphingomonas psychrotolerans]|uniref:Glycoside hydrolase n=1 Tax=Sphingomonas psychrotolerans TaxID=1327635 RepID=A0ABU3N5W8_9SPHN|nr:glycoside hydrolase [Sphingomonas psychrotolerans]MDT8759681.1 glycoside hydrolase [Sphingomonas psychrotolerans]